MARQSPRLELMPAILHHFMAFSLDCSYPECALACITLTYLGYWSGIRQKINCPQSVLLLGTEPENCNWPYTARSIMTLAI